jgi:hypothetical protein
MGGRFSPPGGGAPDRRRIFPMRPSLTELDEVSGNSSNEEKCDYEKICIEFLRRSITLECVEALRGASTALLGRFLPKT